MSTVEFVEPFPDKSTAEKKRGAECLAKKISSASVLSQAEADVIYERDRKIGIASASAENYGKHFITVPDGEFFTPREIKLAGWIAFYANQEGLPFKNALDQVFDYLKRNPTYLSYYTNNVEFTEVSMPSIPADVLAHLERWHIYQIGTGCNFMEAVRDAGHI